MPSNPSPIHVIAAVGVIGFTIHNHIKLARQREQALKSLSRIRTNVLDFNAALERRRLQDLDKMMTGNPIEDFLINLEFRRIMRQNEM